MKRLAVTFAALAMVCLSWTDAIAQTTTNSFPASGNVGIGTLAPQGALDVKGRQVFLGTIPTSIGHSAMEYPSIGYNIVFTNSINTYTYKSNDFASFIHFDVGGLRFKTAPWGNPGAQIPFIESMTISANGNVGVGVTSPEVKLDIKSALGSDALRIRDHQSTTRFSIGQLANYAGNIIDSKNIDLILQSYYSGGTGGNIIFRSGDNNSQPEVLRIDRTGRIGIGTATPDAKLTVAGNVHAREVKVTVVAGADFVFEEDYPLPSLQETEKFVRQNKHLPGIAPAAEMEREGLELGQMNILLLQKVEELTLHVIQLEKEIKVLQQGTAAAAELANNRR